MGTTTLITRVRHLSARLGIKSSQSLPSNIESDLEGIVQEVLRELYRYANWEFLQYYERVRLYAAEDAGTVAVAAAGTDWTGTGTSWDSSIAGRWRIRADGEVYRVDSIASTTSLSTTDAALSALSGETYKLFINEYPLSTYTKRVESAWLDAAQNSRLEFVSQSEMATMKAQRFVYGHPQFVSPKGVDSSGYTLLELYPIPGYDEILHIEGVKKGDIPSSNTDTDDVPDEYSDVVDKLCRAKLYGDYVQEPDKTRVQLAVQEAQVALARMVMQAQVNKGPSRLALDPALYGSRDLGYYRKID